MHWGYFFLALTHRWCLGINCSSGCLMKRHVYWHQPNLGLYVNNAYTFTKVHIHNIYSCSQFRLLLHYKGNVCGVSCLIFLTLVLVRYRGWCSVISLQTNQQLVRWIPSSHTERIPSSEECQYQDSIKCGKIGSVQVHVYVSYLGFNLSLKAFLAWYISIHV